MARYINIGNCAIFTASKVFDGVWPNPRTSTVLRRALVADISHPVIAQQRRSRALRVGLLFIILLFDGYVGYYIDLLLFALERGE